MRRASSSPARCSASASSKTLSVGLETGETRRRVLMINGERVTLPAYVNAMSVFAYSSARLEILRGAPEERRRFLDRGIASIDPGYLEARQPLRPRAAGSATRCCSERDARRRSTPGTRSSSTAAAPLQSGARGVRRGAGGVVRRRSWPSTATTSAIWRSPTARAPSTSCARIRREELRARMSLVGPQRDVLEFHGRRPRRPRRCSPAASRR